MRYEADKPCKTGLVLPNGVPGGDIRSEEGALLWPDRYPETAVQGLETALNVYASAQLQQDPTAGEGKIIKTSWIRYWNPDADCKAADGRPSFRFPKEEIIEWGISWDLAFKDAVGSDYCCGHVWARTQSKFFLVDRIYDKLNFPSMVTAVRALKGRYSQAGPILIEDKANGPAVIATLSGTIPGIIAVNPMGGKVARLNAVSHLHRAGCVYYPDPSMLGYDWVTDKKTGHVPDITGFPFRKHDDTVDAESQMLTFWTQQANPLLDALLAQANAA